MSGAKRERIGAGGPACAASEVVCRISAQYAREGYCALCRRRKVKPRHYRILPQGIIVPNHLMDGGSLLPACSGRNAPSAPPVGQG